MASLPYKPDFKVMPEGWDGTIKDLDEVHYEISKKEDEMLYQEFVQRMNFNKMKVSSISFCLWLKREPVVQNYTLSVSLVHTHAQSVSFASQSRIDLLLKMRRLWALEGGNWLVRSVWLKQASHKTGATLLVGNSMGLIRFRVASSFCC